MRVALIGPGILSIPPNGYGAVEKHIANLAVHLTKRGHEVTILNELAGEYAWAIKVGKRLADQYSIHRYGNFDIVHTHTSFLGGYLARFTNIRYLVYTSHSPLWFIDKPGPRERWGMMWERNAIRFSNDVIALTKEQRFKILADEPWHGLEVVRHGIWAIPNGVDTELFKPQENHHYLNSVCMVGKVIPRKRVAVVAAAVKQARANFHVIGPCPDKDYLKLVQQANPLTYFHIGLPEDILARTLNRMDIYVHASEAEGMSMALLEAMASGLPIIYASPYQNVVKDAGIQVEQNDQPRAYADAIGQLLASETERKMLGQRARSIAEQNYAWDVVAKQVEEVYEALVDMPS